MSEVRKVWMEMEAAAQGAERSDAKWRAQVKAWAARLKRKAPVQKTPGAQRNKEEILRDKIKIISTSVADPSLNYQMILQHSGVSNINIARVSETLTRALEGYNTLPNALQAYKAEYNRKYPRLGPL
jgi:hypothetical protein